MAECVFCARIEDGSELVASNASAVVFRDSFPLSDGHLLVVPREHVGRIEDLGEAAWHDVFTLVHSLARELAGRDGLNIGVNSGSAAGQTVDHAHVHVVPRTEGDVPDPRGGVRWVLPERAAYWDD